MRYYSSFCTFKPSMFRHRLRNNVRATFFAFTMCDIYIFHLEFAKSQRAVENREK